MYLYLRFIFKGLDLRLTSKITSIMTSEKEEVRIACNEAVRDFVKSRSVIKRKVTITLKRIQNSLDAGELNWDDFLIQERHIGDCLDRIKVIDQDILDIYEKHDVTEFDESLLDIELNTQIDYHFGIKSGLNKIKRSLDQSKLESPVASNPTGNIGLSEIVESIKDAMVREPQPPALKCPNYSGLSDRDNFQHFLSQFENVIGCKKNLTNAAKLAYLKGYLRDYAFTVIKHLTNTDSNYSIAIDLLKREFLDVPFIIDNYFNTLITTEPIQDFNYNRISNFLNEARAILHDLKGHNVDFFTEDSAGNKLIAHIIYSKLPLAFKRELKNILNINYPSIKDVFDNYTQVLRTLEKRHPAKNLKVYK